MSPNTPSTPPLEYDKASEGAIPFRPGGVQIGSENRPFPVKRSGLAESNRKTFAPFWGKDGPIPAPQVEKWFVSTVTVLACRSMAFSGTLTHTPEASSRVTMKG